MAKQTGLFRVKKTKSQEKIEILASRYGIQIIWDDPTQTKACKPLISAETQTTSPNKREAHLFKDALRPVFINVKRETNPEDNML